ncbi:MAG: hypothetical protein O2945_09135 [Planctomycetota bacterium]|nr:hypothetical protein [Planctomycetota bacterium]
MFGLFSPRCPLEIGIKAWIERRFRDLAAGIGGERIRQAKILLPGDADVPQIGSGSDQELASMFAQVCYLMDISHEGFQLATTEDVSLGGASGAYLGPERTGEGSRIILAKSLPQDPHRLLATSAYLIGHEVVRQKFPEIARSQDVSWAIDLVPACYGLGVFAANSLRRGGVGGCGSGGCSSCGPDETATKGVLTPTNYGHVLALLAWVRDEEAPAWAESVGRDVAHTMKPSLKFLTKTGDCAFSKADFGLIPENRSVGDLRAILNSSLKTQQFDVLRELVRRSDAAEELASDIEPFLRDREASVRRQAAAALSSVPKLTSDTFLEMLRLMDDSEGAVRGALTYALRPGCGEEQLAQEALMKLINDPHLTTAGQAAGALSQFDDLPNGALDAGLKLLRRGVAKLNDDVVSVALDLLKLLTDDVESLVAARFNDDDDVLHMVNGHLHPEAEADESLSLPIAVPPSV